MIVVVSRDIQHQVQSISKAPRGTWGKSGTLANKNAIVNINFPEILLWHGYIRISGHLIKNMASEALPSITSLNRRSIYQICKYDLSFLGKWDWSKNRERPSSLSQTRVSIRLHVTVTRASSVWQPASTGDKCHNTIFPGMGSTGDTQVWPSSVLGGTAVRVAWLGGPGWGLAHVVGSTGPTGDFEQAGGWPVNLHSLNLATHCESCRCAPRTMAPQRDHLQGRFSNSLNNTEKGWCKDNDVFETQQRLMSIVVPRILCVNTQAI